MRSLTLLAVVLTNAMERKNYILAIAATGFLAACGAPTPYQQYIASKKSDCELACEKAHTEKDRQGRVLCVRACEAKNDLDLNQKPLQ